MASLPAGRLAYKQRPFSHCGMDYFGPMIVKIGRRREKRWGCLFTCLTTRAVSTPRTRELIDGNFHCHGSSTLGRASRPPVCRIQRQRDEFPWGVQGISRCHGNAEQE